MTKSTLDETVLRDLHAQGLNDAEIASRLDVPHHVVFRCRKVRLKLPSNTLHGASPVKGAENNFWKGGRVRLARGYVLIHRPGHPNANSDGYVREHRLVMEEKLGRYLEKREVVVHLNGDKGDNRPENLKHYANHHKLAKARKEEAWGKDADARRDDPEKRKAQIERYKATRRANSSFDEATFRELHAQGVTWKVIAEHFGVSQATLHYRKRMLKLPARLPGKRRG